MAFFWEDACIIAFIEVYHQYCKFVEKQEINCKTFHNRYG